ncbi:DUF3289 family protein [Lacrimispora sp.]|uniref:DUF3289 family protein n=1 Tax=Lacrimispora sp. TaxID=2719234 RepID=UPI0028AB0C78|nr:DUF3289 family protein [Lacrimispora sp.]
MGESGDRNLYLFETDKMPQESYVVREAKLQCDYGSKPSVLNLPIDHGAYVGGQPFITERDSKNMNIGTFGICSKTQKPCKPAVQKWLNGNGQKKIFDINTMDMEATVLEQSSYGVCTSNLGFVTFASSGQMPAPGRGWKRFQDKVVFMSNRRPGTLIGRYPDLGSNDVDKYTLLGGHNEPVIEGVEDPNYFKSHPYFKFQEKENVDTLFDEFQTMVNDFSWADSEMKNVMKKMVDHFRYGNGADFYDDVLTSRVKDHEQTLMYKECIEKILRYELRKVKGDLDKLSIAEMNEYLQEKAKYPNYSFNNVFNGLFVAIHAMWGNNVILKSYKLQGDYHYKGILKFEFFDHFGLGGEDMANTTRYAGILIPDLVGMRAWFTLQHYTKFGGKFKPFVDYEIVEYEFEGYLDDEQYDYIEEELKVIRTGKAQVV